MPDAVDSFTCELSYKLTLLVSTLYYWHSAF